MAGESLSEQTSGKLARVMPVQFSSVQFSSVQFSATGILTAPGRGEVLMPPRRAIHLGQSRQEMPTLKTAKKKNKTTERGKEEKGSGSSLRRLARNIKIKEPAEGRPTRKQTTRDRLLPCCGPHLLYVLESIHLCSRSITAY